MGTSIDERIEMLQRGENPNLVCRMVSGWAVLCDLQYLPGYCILLPDPVVASINVLEPSQRAQYLCDMTLIGDALLKVTGAFRINYAILGNTDEALHAHIVPRYSWEPDEFRKGPPWSYGKAVMDDRLFDLERDRNLIQQVAEAIRELSE